MTLTSEEIVFLQAWMHDELHFRQGIGPAKRLERKHQLKPAELADLIAAWLPDPGEQFWRAEQGGVETEPTWPWASHAEFEDRLREAREELARRAGPRASLREHSAEEVHPAAH